MADFAQTYGRHLYIVTSGAMPTGGRRLPGLRAECRGESMRRARAGEMCEVSKTIKLS